MKDKLSDYEASGDDNIKQYADEPSPVQWLEQKFQEQRGNLFTAQFVDAKEMEHQKFAKKALWHYQRGFNDGKNYKQKEQIEEFKQYRRKSISEMRPYVEGEILDGKVSISQADKDNGSPKVGDMIARNPKNHEDQWLVAKQYFEDNLEEI
jgi:hypothetical protein